MVIGYHLILTGYGHWLPNDPRGSMSQTVHAPDLAALAKAHFGRKRVQPSVKELRSFYQEAQKHLHFPILWWGDAERGMLGDAFGQCVESLGLTCYACAVLRNHAHLLVRRHRLKAEEMLAGFKQHGRDRMTELGATPTNHPVFSADVCHVFKSSVGAMRSCVRYIADNYVKHRLDPVSVPWVQIYDDWPQHKQRRRGH